MLTILVLICLALWLLLLHGWYWFSTPRLKTVLALSNTLCLTHWWIWCLTLERFGIEIKLIQLYFALIFLGFTKVQIGVVYSKWFMCIVHEVWPSGTHTQSSCSRLLNITIVGKERVWFNGWRCNLLWVGWFPWLLGLMTLKWFLALMA